MITSVKIGGTAVDLNTINHDVTITVGRRDITTSFAPSSCRITFYDVVASTYTALVGKTLTVAGTAYQLFGGYITDVRLTVATATSGARCDIIAAGPSSRLGLMTANQSGYASMTVSGRLFSIAQECTTQDATMKFNAEVGSSESLYTISSAAAQPDSATSLMQNVVEPYGGLIYDNPYDDTSPTGRIAYYMNDALIIFPGEVAGNQVEWSPTFEQSGQIINDVTVTYDTGTINRSNTTSQTLYGKRSRRVTTTIDNATNATDLADNVISRSRRPRWSISNVSVIQSTTGAEFLYQRIGGSLKITSLPAGSPTSTYTGIVQGWEHRVSNGKMRTTFYLADPSDVGKSIRWQDTGSNWTPTNATLIWDNALTEADFYS